MTVFRRLYFGMGIGTAAIFIIGLAGVLAPGFWPLNWPPQSVLTAGMAILGLTPIFGLAIVGASWLRNGLTDAVGWAAVGLAILTAYLWIGI